MNHPPTHRIRPVGSRATRGGFTLIEILVVVAIVMILAALAFMGMNRATQAARQAKAIGALRTTTSAAMAYATENGGRINTLKWEGDPEEGGPNAWVSNSFWGRMEEHVFVDLKGGTQKELGAQMKDVLAYVFTTENASTMSGTLLAGSKIYHDSSGLPVPFAFNRYVYQWNEWVTLSEVGGAADFVYATYGFGFFDEADARAYVERPKDGTAPKNNIYYFPNRKAITSFLDGHVESLEAPVSKRRFHQDFLDSNT